MQTRTLGDLAVSALGFGTMSGFQPASSKYPTAERRPAADEDVVLNHHRHEAGAQGYCGTTKILILGAHGQIARVATRLLLERTGAALTLYLRRAERLSALAGDGRVTMVDGDVLDAAALGAAMVGQDVVYANLSGAMERQARAIVAAMTNAGVARLLFISSMGIYDEVPGKKHGSVLDPYRQSAAVIEASDLDYTIIRPAWLNDRDEVAYSTTVKGEPFDNADAYISRKSVADLVVRLVATPGLGSRESLGVNAF